MQGVRNVAGSRPGPEGPAVTAHDERPFTEDDSDSDAQWSWLNEDEEPQPHGETAGIAPELRSDLEKVIQEALDWTERVLSPVVRLAQFMPLLASGPVQQGTADRIVYASDALASAGDDLFLICDRLRSAAESAMNAMNPPTTTSDEGAVYV